jgi:hypothetical protein
MTEISIGNASIAQRLEAVVGRLAAGLDAIQASRKGRLAGTARRREQITRVKVEGISTGKKSTIEV